MALVTFYHVRVSVQGQQHDEVKVDMDAETLERLILRPYRSGEPITISGKTVEMGALERIRVSSSEEPSQQIIDRLRAVDRRSEIVVMGGPSYRWRAAARASDVTDQFITGPPGSGDLALGASATQRPSTDEFSDPSVSSGAASDAGAVFVVAGRDSKAITAIVQLLRSLGLRIVEWEHAVARTGLPNPYVGDIVAAGLRMARAAVVIFTPDDMVQLREDLLHDDDGPEEREVRGQARPNVYYEAGIADTLGRDRTVIVEIGNVKSFSDAAGRHVVRYDGTPAKRHALAERLRLTGLAVDTGGNDWLTAGEVASALEDASAAIAGGTVGTVATLVSREEVRQQLEGLDELYGDLQSRSRYDDFSDLPQDSLQYAIRAQTLVDRVAAGTTYAAETNQVRESQPHMRIPVLRATLVAIRTEMEGDDLASST